MNINDIQDSRDFDGYDIGETQRWKSITELKGVGPETAAAFKSAGISSVQGLVNYSKSTPDAAQLLSSQLSTFMGKSVKPGRIGSFIDQSLGLLETLGEMSQRPPTAIDENPSTFKFARTRNNGSRTVEMSDPPPSNFQQLTKPADPLPSFTQTPEPPLDVEKIKRASSRAERAMNRIISNEDANRISNGPAFSTNSSRAWQPKEDYSVDSLLGQLDKNTLKQLDAQKRLDENNREVLRIRQMVGKGDNKTEMFFDVGRDQKSGLITVNNADSPSGGFAVQGELNYNTNQRTSALDVLQGKLAAATTSGLSIVANLQRSNGSEFVNYRELNADRRSKLAGKMQVVGNALDYSGKPKADGDFTDGELNDLLERPENSDLARRSGNSVTLNTESLARWAFDNKGRGFVGSSAKREQQQGVHEFGQLFAAPGIPVREDQSPARFAGQDEANRGNVMRSAVDIRPGVIVPEGQAYMRKDAGYLGRNSQQTVKLTDEQFELMKQGKNEQALGWREGTVFQFGGDEVTGMREGDHLYQDADGNSRVNEIPGLPKGAAGSYSHARINTVRLDEETRTARIGLDRFIPAWAGSPKAYGAKDNAAPIEPEALNLSVIGSDGSISPTQVDILRGAPKTNDAATFALGSFLTSQNSTQGLQSTFEREVQDNWRYNVGVDELVHRTDSPDLFEAGSAISKKRATTLFNGGVIGRDMSLPDDAVDAGGYNPKVYDRMAREWYKDQLQVVPWGQVTIDKNVKELYENETFEHGGQGYKVLDNITHIGGEGEEARYSADYTTQMHIVDRLESTRMEYDTGRHLLSGEMLDNMAIANPGLYRNLKERDSMGEFSNTARDLIQSVTANNRPEVLQNLEKNNRIIDFADLGYQEEVFKADGTDSESDKIKILQSIAKGEHGDKAIRMGQYVLPSARTALSNLTLDADGAAINTLGGKMMDAMSEAQNVEDVKRNGGDMDIAWNAMNAKAHDVRVEAAELADKHGTAHRAFGYELDMLGGQAQSVQGMAHNAIGMSKDQVYEMAGVYNLPKEQREEAKKMALRGVRNGDFTMAATMFPHTNADAAYPNMKVSLIEDLKKKEGFKHITSSGNNFWMSPTTTMYFGKDQDGDGVYGFGARTIVNKDGKLSWSGEKLKPTSEEQIVSIAKRNQEWSDRVEGAQAGIDPLTGLHGATGRVDAYNSGMDKSRDANLDSKKRSIRTLNEILDGSEHEDGTWNGKRTIARAKEQIGPLYDVTARTAVSFDRAMGDRYVQDAKPEDKQRAQENNRRYSEASSQFAKYAYQKGVDYQQIDDEGITSFQALVNNLKYDVNPSGKRRSSINIDDSGPESFGNNTGALTKSIFKAVASFGVSNDDYNTDIVPSMARRLLPLNMQDNEQAIAKNEELLRDYKRRYDEAPNEQARMAVKPNMAAFAENAGFGNDGAGVLAMVTGEKLDEYGMGSAIPALNMPYAAAWSNMRDATSRENNPNPTYDLKHKKNIKESLLETMNMFSGIKGLRKFRNKGGRSAEATAGSFEAVNKAPTSVTQHTSDASIAMGGTPGTSGVGISGNVNTLTQQAMNDTPIERISSADGSASVTVGGVGSASASGGSAPGADDGGGGFSGGGSGSGNIDRQSRNYSSEQLDVQRDIAARFGANSDEYKHQTSLHRLENLSALRANAAPRQQQQAPVWTGSGSSDLASAFAGDSMPNAKVSGQDVLDFAEAASAVTGSDHSNQTGISADRPIGGVSAQKPSLAGASAGSPAQSGAQSVSDAIAATGGAGGNNNNGGVGGPVLMPDPLPPPKKPESGVQNTGGATPLGQSGAEPEVDGNGNTIIKSQVNKYTSIAPKSLAMSDVADVLDFSADKFKKYVELTRMAADETQNMTEAQMKQLVQLNKMVDGNIKAAEAFEQRKDNISKTDADKFYGDKVHNSAIEQALLDPSGNAAENFNGENLALTQDQKRAAAVRMSKYDQDAALEKAAASGEEAPEINKMSLLGDRTKSGRAKRDAAMDAGEFGEEGSLEKMGSKALGGAMRGLGEAASPGFIFAARALKGILVDPSLKAAEQYEEMSASRDNQLLKAGAITATDANSGTFGAIRSRAARQEIAAYGAGQQAYETFKPLMDFGADNNMAGAMSIGGTAIAGGALGARLLPQIMGMSGPAGALLGAGIAGSMALGSYAVSNSTDYMDISRYANSGNVVSDFGGAIGQFAGGIINTFSGDSQESEDNRDRAAWANTGVLSDLVERGTSEGISRADLGRQLRTSNLFTPEVRELANSTAPLSGYVDAALGGVTSTPSFDNMTEEERAAVGAQLRGEITTPTMLVSSVLGAGAADTVTQDDAFNTAMANFANGVSPASAPPEGTAPSGPEGFAAERGSLAASFSEGFVISEMAQATISKLGNSYGIGSDTSSGLVSSYMYFNPDQAGISEENRDYLGIAGTYGIDPGALTSGLASASGLLGDNMEGLSQSYQQVKDSLLADGPDGIIANSRSLAVNTEFAGQINQNLVSQGRDRIGLSDIDKLREEYGDDAMKYYSGSYMAFETEYMNSSSQNNLEDQGLRRVQDAIKEGDFASAGRLMTSLGSDTTNAASLNMQNMFGITMSQAQRDSMQTLVTSGNAGMVSAGVDAQNLIASSGMIAGLQDPEALRANAEQLQSAGLSLSSLAAQRTVSSGGDASISSDLLLGSYGVLQDFGQDQTISPEDLEDAQHESAAFSARTSINDQSRAAGRGNVVAWDNNRVNRILSNRTAGSLYQSAQGIMSQQAMQGLMGGQTSSILQSIISGDASELEGNSAEMTREMGQYQAFASNAGHYMNMGYSPAQINAASDVLGGMSATSFNEMQGARSGNMYEVSSLFDRGGTGRDQAKAMGYTFAPINMQTGQAWSYANIAPSAMQAVNNSTAAQQGYFDGVSQEQLQGGTSGMAAEIMQINRGMAGYQASMGVKMRNAQMQMMTGGGTVGAQGFVTGGDNLAGFTALTGISNVGTGQGMWAIEDRMTAIQREKQDISMQMQGKSLGLADRGLELKERQFYENFNLKKQQFEYNTGYQRQSMGIQRGQALQSREWQGEDMAFSRQQAQMGFGWQMEDADRNLRYARGRDRQDQMRQKGRAAVQYSTQEGQRDREEDRFKTKNKWEDDAFAREKKHFEQGVTFQKEEMKLQEKHFKENLELEKERQAMAKESFALEMKFMAETRALEDQKRLLERQHQVWSADMQNTIAMASAGAQIRVMELQNAMTGLGLVNEKHTAQYSLQQQILPPLLLNFSDLNTSFGALRDLIVETRDTLMDLAPQIEQGNSGGQPLNSDGSPNHNGNPEDGLSDGGYTGDGLKKQVANVTVHKGEYVVPQNGTLVMRGDNSGTNTLLEKIYKVLSSIEKQGPGRVNATIHTASPKISASDLVNQTYRRK